MAACLANAPSARDTQRLCSRACARARVERQWPHASPMPVGIARFGIGRSPSRRVAGFAGRMPATACGAPAGWCGRRRWASQRAPGGQGGADGGGLVAAWSRFGRVGPTGGLVSGLKLSTGCANRGGSRDRGEKPLPHRHSGGLPLRQWACPRSYARCRARRSRRPAGWGARQWRMDECIPGEQGARAGGIDLGEVELTEACAHHGGNADRLSVRSGWLQSPRSCREAQFR
jgi:hypothetical protein